MEEFSQEVQQTQQDTQQQNGYRAHDYTDRDGQRKADEKGRPLKKGESGRWIIDTEEAEYFRLYAKNRYHELKQKSADNKAYYEEYTVDRIRRADKQFLDMDKWGTRDIAQLFHATPEQVRGWIKRNILEAQRDEPNGHYFCTSQQIMAFWYWTRKHEAELYKYAAQLFGYELRQLQKEGQR